MNKLKNDLRTMLYKWQSKHRYFLQSLYYVKHLYNFRLYGVRIVRFWPSGSIQSVSFAVQSLEPHHCTQYVNTIFIDVVCLLLLFIVLFNDSQCANINFLKINTSQRRLALKLIKLPIKVGKIVKVYKISKKKDTHFE